MSTIIKINEDKYTVGNFTVIRQGDKWLITNSKDKRATALYFDKFGAIHNAVLLHTCGYMAQEGTRELLTLIATESYSE